MIDEQALKIPKMLFEAIVGVGGLGTGAAFRLDEGQQLPINGVRSGCFVDHWVPSRLHIVMHVLKVLMGASFRAVPVGKVGEDTLGKQLLELLDESDMRLRNVTVEPGTETFSRFNVIFPDGQTLTLQTGKSASSLVDTDYMQRVEVEFANFAADAIVLTMPDVPLEARFAALEFATKYHSFRVAVFNEDEISQAIAGQFLQHIDLIVLTIQEAAALVGGKQEGQPRCDLDQPASE